MIKHILMSRTAKKILPWLVCFTAALNFLYQFIQMNMFNAISHELMASFAIDATHLGYLSFTYLCGNILFLIPAGMLLDRFSTRRLIFISLSLEIFGISIFAFSYYFYAAAFGQFIAGVGSTFTFLSCMVLASRWFPPKRMALITGLIAIFAMIGGMIAQTPLAFLAQHFGWRTALVFDVALAFLPLCATYLFIFDNPEPFDLPNYASKNSPETSRDIKQSFLCILKSPQNWFCGVYTSFMNFPIIILGALWGSLHLHVARSLSLTQAASVASMIFLGTVIGAPLIGFISDHLEKRRTPMIVCAVIALFLILGILYLPHLSYGELIIAYLLLGLFSSAQILTYPIITENNRADLTGTAMSFSAFLVMGGGGLAQLISSRLLDWGHAMHGLAAHAGYSDLDFKFALSLIPIGFVIALGCALSIKETRGDILSDSQVPLTTPDLKSSN